MSSSSSPSVSTLVQTLSSPTCMSGHLTLLYWSETAEMWKRLILTHLCLFTHHVANSYVVIWSWLYDLGRPGASKGVSTDVCRGKHDGWIHSGSKRNDIRDDGWFATTNTDISWFANKWSWFFILCRAEKKNQSSLSEVITILSAANLQMFEWSKPTFAQWANLQRAAVISVF